MRLIRVPAASWITPFYTQGNPESVNFRLGGYDMSISGDSIRFFDYDSWRWRNMPILYQGVDYFIQGDANANITPAAFKNGDLVLRDASGEEMALDAELQYALVSAFYQPGRDKFWRNETLIQLEYDFDSQDFQNVFVDFERGEIKKFGNGASKYHLLDDGFLMYEEIDRTVLSCHDFNLDLRWTFKPDIAVPNDRELFSGPEVHDDQVIFSYGWSRMEQIVDPRRKPEGPVESTNDYGFYDAVLYALDLADGSIRWQATIPKSIDNLRIRDGVIYICSANEIHALDANTGETRQVIDTGLSDDYNRLTCHKSYLEIAGNYLYFCHATDGCLLIYRLDDLELIRRLDLPFPHTLSEYIVNNETSGKCYFQTRKFLLTSSLAFDNSFSILEVDPNRPEGELEIYEGPPVDIELRPSEEDADEVEVWINISDVPLDEAMVYAEYHSENMAYHHGYQEHRHEDYNETENFNGKVHLRYSGSDRSAEEVNEALKALKKRFNEWVRDNRNRTTASTEPLKVASLDAVYKA